MAKKSRERYKDRNQPAADPNAKPAPTLQALKRRRYKRLLFVGLLGLLFPLFEFVAYQYRAITISITNKTDEVVRSVKVTYDGGAFEIAELRPGGVDVRVIRPNYNFGSTHFGTYLMKISFLVDKGYNSQMGRAGAIDFSANELYTIEAIPPNNQFQLKHTTRPGFPLSLVRDLMERLGMG
jgi:hypothetical protein